MAQVERATSTGGKKYLTDKPVINDNTFVDMGTNSTIAGSVNMNIYSDDMMGIQAIKVLSLSSEEIYISSEANILMYYLEADTIENTASGYIYEIVNYDFNVNAGRNIYLESGQGILITGDIYVDGSKGVTTTQTFKDATGANKTMTIKSGIITNIA